MLVQMDFTNIHSNGALPLPPSAGSQMSLKLDTVTCNSFNRLTAKTNKIPMYSLTVAQYHRINMLYARYEIF